MKRGEPRQPTSAANRRSDKEMQTEFLLLALYEKPFLNFAEVCKAIGISLQAGYNLRCQGKFPIALLESPIRASVTDVADYIDRMRDQAKEKAGL